MFLTAGANLKFLYGSPISSKLKAPDGQTDGRDATLNVASYRRVV